MKFLKGLAEKYKGIWFVLKIAGVYFLILLILFVCVSYITRNSVDVVPKEDNIRKTDCEITDIILSPDEQYAYFCGYGYRFYEDEHSRVCGYIIKVDRNGNILSSYSGKEGYLQDAKLLENVNLLVMHDNITKLEFSPDLKLISSELNYDQNEQKSNNNSISFHKSKIGYYRSINTSDGGLFAASFSYSESKPVVNYYKSSTVPEFYNIVFDVFYYAKHYWYAFIILIILFTGMIESVKEQKKEKAMQKL